MNKVGLIIQREYSSRVKKRSFIIMSVLGPILFAALVFLPGYLVTMEDKEAKVIAVVDETNIMDGVLQGTDYIRFDYIEGVAFEDLKKTFTEGGYYAVLQIPANILTTERVVLYSDLQTTLSVNDQITKSLNQFIRNLRLEKENVSQDILQRIETNVRVNTVQRTGTGEEKSGSAELASAIGYISGFLMYMFIFMFGSMIMRAVIEEKTSRIVEIIVSSVKPYQLMMGKVIGVSLVGLTQFMIWILLTLGIVTGVKSVVFRDADPAQIEQAAQSIMESGAVSPTSTMNMTDAQQIFTDIFDKLGAVNFPLILGAFLFFFLGGYLLYASLFAAIGSAVDNETETQQFMLPVTIPIVAGLLIMISAMTNPHNEIAVIFSIIPLTSPIVMMARIPYGVETWQLILSAILLVLTFMGAIWMAAKIYRTGILMYGKKTSYKELWKWLKYRD